MAINFENAPLIEVIVELRWGAALPFPPQGLSNAPTHLFNVNLEASQHEEFFMNFGAECGSRGLQRAERIVPQGFPVIPGQVVYRFRSNDRSLQNLLQVGPGVFTVNGLPPYKGWPSFEAFMGRGIDALLASRPLNETENDFSSVNIRFINGFGKDYFEDTSRLAFLKSLGFIVQVPKELEAVSQEDNSTFFNMNYITNLKGGAKLQVTVAEGVKEGVPIQVVELGTTHESVRPTKKDLLEIINISHDLIEKIFMDMTAPIHSKMKPKEV
ncbi:TIGR04255 family protein [Pseudomonas sp. R76]|uniref:TIGR04255 family protein n=1 Tax=Pseudomonas sp. R76 TaxID=1573711 RepID=UPI0013203650|nr:TIGR04255 family protein [Pseudomonas sp. R76]QHD04233.1 hypothetical protein PspR76_00100 [Pseudomonas sp. R76]